MFPNNFSNLNIPNSQAEIKNDSENRPLVSNDFATPNIPTEKSHDPIRAFLFIILMVFILITVSVFGYSLLLSNQTDSLKQTLQNYDKNNSLTSFNSNLSDIKNLSQRLKILDNIYNNHIYISQMLLPVLESLTESSSQSYVYFNKFSVRVGKNNVSNVFISGVAIDYESLIRQINNFKNPSYSSFINNFKLNSLSLDQSGNVLFDVSFDANISGKNYNEYQNAISNNLLSSNVLSGSVNIKPGPLFQQKVIATNTVPVSVQAIYDSLSANTAKAELFTVKPETNSTSSNKNSSSSSNQSPVILIGN